jgi:hypothetical protein
MLTNTLAPTVTYALTSGPTQPEATSFEPVDTTDMVNLQTGDLAYNIPLLEVPGPEGGYPLSLSYHAGIQPNEDASWVGWGWTLNPGAVTRNVNGYPDDWYTPTTSRRDFWNGGNTNTYNIGISVGIAETPATVSFGLSFSQDTYRGFGVGWDVGVGAQIGGKGSPFNASIGVGVSPYGDPYMSGGLGMTVFGGKDGGLTGSIGVSATTNFESLDAGFSGGIGYSTDGKVGGHSLGGSLLGSSISTGGGKPSLKLGGLTASVSNSKAGQISSSSHGFHVDIPVYYGINLSLGFSKTRYWSDETANVSTHGSLFPNGWGGTGNSWGSIADNQAYDEYSLLEDPSYKNIIDNPDPSKVQGGAFPDFDVYSVNAQGLGGNMRPYLLQGGIINQNIYNGSTPVVTYYSPGVTDYQPYFRFENDFSNSYRQNNAAFYSNASLNLRAVTPPFDGSPLYGFHDNNGNDDGSTGYGGGNALAGSRYVNTNLQVQPRNALGYSKSQRYFDGHMIAGYSITNESGMTYHFGLPAYSYGEQSFQELLNNKTPLTYTRLTRTSPYAYTWYLTTVTGPDYVDRNGDGKADDGDWGYWVDFEYGKWSDDYVWRNPSQGYQKDEDNQFVNCSMGHREVYYLNAIRTRTHVALFEKQVRLDGKGSAQGIFGTNASNGDYYNDGMFDNSSAQSLCLSKIYLLNASDENFVGTSAGASPNTLDNADVDAVGRTALEAKALRVIDLNYDYSLCQGTTNSFDISNPSVKSGKLTLNNVVTRGKGGVNLLPAMQLSYDLTGTDANTQAGVSLSAGSFSTSNGNFQLGDMIQQIGSPNTYCGVITGKSGSGGTYTYTLANGNYSGGTVTTTVSATKNPSYNKDAYDQWGLYKSDYNTTLIAQNENLYRSTSVLSSKSEDAWCLRTITSPLGSQIKIAYEPDLYSSVGINNNYQFTINTASTEGSATSNSISYPVFMWSDNYYTQNTNVGYNNIKFTLNTLGYAISDFFQAGGTGKIVLADKYPSPFGPTIEAIESAYTINTIDADGTIHATLSNPIPNVINVILGNGSVGGSFSFTGIAAGNVSPTVSATNVYGGGIRIAKVTTSDISGFQAATSYNYNTPAVSGLSSGTTSYTPGILDISGYVVNPNVYGDDLNLKAYKKVLYTNANSLYSIAREIPPPMVMYEYVSVTKQVQNPDETSGRNVPGTTQYQFEVFHPYMIGRLDIPVTSSYGTTTGRTSATTNWGTMTAHNLALMDFTNAIGNVKRVVQYDGNNKILSEMVSHYLHDGLANLPLSDFMTQYKARLAQFYYQGYLQERYSEVKVVNEQGYTSNSQVMSTLSTREKYPCIQTGQTVINYVNGTQTTSTNLGFDFYSGAVTQTLETDAYGNNFMTQTIPAYRKYPGMGLMVNTASNKNMLTQTAASYMWKVDGSNNKLAAASVTTWSNGFAALNTDGMTYIQDGRSEQISGTYYPNGNVWREQSTYNWLPTGQTSDGLTPYASFADFNWSTPGSSDTRWKKISDVTLYDVYSKALEAKDINGNYAATRMNYGEQKVMVTGGPANYYELAYSGAEDAAVNQTNNIFVQAADGTQSTAAAHTGAQSLLLGTSGKRGFLYTVPIVISGTNGVIAGRSYEASVWVKPASGTMSGVKLYYSVGGTVKGSSPGTSAKTAGAWSLVNLPINGSDLVSGSTLAVWCQNDNTSVQAYADDMRFQPVNAATTAYVYDPFSGELTHILDNSNLYTRFEYDGAGRLARTYKEKLTLGEFKTHQYQYNYGTTQYFNAPINNVTYFKNDCNASAGYVGGGVSVTIPANTYNSFISPADANARANFYAQSYANQHASCICMPGFTWASGISWNDAQFNMNGTRVSFGVDFNFPSGSTGFTLGNLSVSCARPAATRIVPVTIGSSVVNVIFTTNGLIQVQLVSGPVPTGEVAMAGVYDTQINLAYSDQASGTYTRATSTCPSGQVGGTYTYVVPAYIYVATDQTTANNLALADVQANGQNRANAAGPCLTQCNFNWASGVSVDGYSISTTSSGAVNFTFAFYPPAGYTNGTLGTITGGCTPSSGARSITVTDQYNGARSWTVFFYSNGTVTIQQASGPAPIADDEIIVLGSITY